MRRFAVYAAAAAITMTGATGITAQAAVRTYIAGGNCSGGWSDGNQGFANNDSLFSGNSCSVDQILQMIIPSGSGTDCSNNWGGNMIPIFPGNRDNPLNSGCTDNWNDMLKPNCPPVNCPDFSGNQGNDGSCIQNPGEQNPGNQIPGTQNPGTQNPGTQNPGSQNPGSQNPGTQNPGTQNPGTQNPGTQNPGSQNPGTQNPDFQNPDSDQTYIQQVIDLVNQERAKAGLSPVTEAADLSAAAAVRAQEITRSFSHTRPDGTYYNTVLNGNGVSYMGSGENIAYGQATPAAVMNGWMNSQGHRANILNKNFTEIGVGCYENGSGVKYWVQLFTY